MTNVIGYKGTPEARKYVWANLRDSRNSYNTFRNGPSEHEFAIASNDKKVYDYYLSNYIKVA